MNKGRHVCLDLLRIISMIMIVTLHFINKGGLQDIFDMHSINYWAVKLIYNMSLVAVNCYVLISGYFLVNSKFKLKNIVLLCGEALFWSVGIMLVFIIAHRPIGGLDMIKSMLPVTMETYWFITAYIIMYALFPFYNIIIKRIDKRAYQLFLIILIIVFSLWKSVMPLSEALKTDGFGIVWLSVLYFIGGYIRIFGLDWSKRACITVYMISVLVTISIKALFEVIPITFLNQFANEEGPYGQYNTFTIMIASVALFILFEKTDIKNRFAVSAVAKIAPLTLGVYLIHEQLMLRKILWTEIIDCRAIAGSSFFVLYSVIAVVGVFAVCTVLEKVRKELAIKLKITKWLSEKSFCLEGKIKRYMETEYANE